MDESLQDITAGSINNINSIKIYRKRWLVLFSYCCVTFSNALLFTTFPAINKPISYYYDVSPNLTDWLSNLFNLVCIFVIIPSSYFIFSFGKRTSLIIAASLNAIGGCLHYAGIHQNGFHFIFAGQIATALGIGIILQLPVGIATSWFGSNEQARATSIGVLANILGIAVGFAQPGSMVPDVTDKIVLKEKLSNLFISQLVFLMINLLTVYLFFYDNPKLPPSYSAGLQKNTSEENKLSFVQ